MGPNVSFLHNKENHKQWKNNLQKGRKYLQRMQWHLQWLLFQTEWDVLCGSKIKLQKIVKQSLNKSEIYRDNTCIG